MNKQLHPILKWAGGKRQLLSVLLTQFPKFERYVEPFLGGGSVLFALQPKCALVNDVNSEIINLYKIIKRSPHRLIEILEEHKKNHSAEYYYKIRGLDRDLEKFNAISKIERAARTLYLNRTCFNGLYRVNSAGCFNTPIGRYKNPQIVNPEAILALANFFRESQITFLNNSYEQCLLQLNSADFVYLDPPYDAEVALSKGMFTAYTKTGFSRKDQMRLKEMCDRLSAQNIKFVQSNSNTTFIQELYKGYNLQTITVSRMINAKALNRKASAQEVIIKNF